MSSPSWAFFLIIYTYSPVGTQIFCPTPSYHSHSLGYDVPKSEIGSWKIFNESRSDLERVAHDPPNCEAGFLCVDLPPSFRHLFHFGYVLSPIMQSRGVEVRAIRPDKGMDFGVNFHLIEEFFIL